MLKQQKLYYAGNGARFDDEQAQIYGECIDKIIESNGGVADTQLIVDNAKDEKSPIHDYFQWDDTKAANEHRKYQARKLIQTIEIEVVENDKPSQIVRAFHYIKKKNQIKKGDVGFAKFETIHKSADDYDRFIVQAYLRRIRELNSKYKKYTQLEPIITSIELVLEKHTEVANVR